MIKNFQAGLAKGYNLSGSFENLNEVLKKFDSKNKKGIDKLYSQNIPTISSSFSRKNLNHQKSNILPGHPLSLNGKNFPDNSNFACKTLSPPPRNCVTSGRTMKSERTPSKTNSRSKIERTPSKGKLTFRTITTPPKTSSKIKVCRAERKQMNPDDITLSTKNIQKFFAYVLIDNYNANFSRKGFRGSFAIGNRIYGKFQERNQALKEKAKPIPGTNKIMVYNEMTKTSQMVKVNLIKDIHGYELFPQGARHICIGNKTLFITGGVDLFGKPTNICLTYDLDTNELTRIKDSIFYHCYHSLEMIENYDCFVMIGGEKCRACEMYDLQKDDWVALPELNFARANTSVYFNEKTNTLYSLFGMLGPMYKNKVSSDLIETLDFENLSFGWKRLDYYKKSMIDLYSHYASAFPFTLEKLIIRGTKNNRTNNNFYAIFDMEKYEMYFASEKIVNEIQKEEAQLKSYTDSYKQHSTSNSNKKA